MHLISYRDEPQMYSASSTQILSFIEKLKERRSKSYDRRNSICLAALTDDLIS